jgi:hypothetical protein
MLGHLQSRIKRRVPSQFHGNIGGNKLNCNGLKSFLNGELYQCLKYIRQGKMSSLHIL